MRLYYIGTGAADWTAEAGARDGITRRFTATLVDSTLLIDLAPTTPESFYAPSALLGQVTDVIYTHSHNDHYSYSSLAALAAQRTVRVWAEASFAARIPSIPGVEVHSLTVGETVNVGEYTVTPLRANHRISAHPEETALHYIITDGVRRIFWGADGSWLPTETWYALRAARPFDRIVLDGTLGEANGDYRIFEHNSLPMVRLMKDALYRAECLTAGGEIWVTHLSRDAHDSPLAVEITLSREGIHVAKDDLEDEF